MDITDYYRTCAARLEQLTVYRGILRDDTLHSFLMLCHAVSNGADVENISRARSVFIAKLLHQAEKLGLEGPLFKRYLIHLFLHDENLFSLACERGESPGRFSLRTFTRSDVETLFYLCDICGGNANPLFDNEINALFAKQHNDVFAAYRPITPRSNPFLEKLNDASTADAMMVLLTDYYTQKGAGEMGAHAMFHVRKGTAQTPILVGLSRADPVTLEDIVGLDKQKETLIRNTEAFLLGYPANNVLLSGSRGTGKSSCVKAIINRYANAGLRLVEVRKNQTRALPALMRLLASRGKRFIVFMDDLSFESFESQYKYLKSLLEGGASEKPPNVLFYATSNRRHIIREQFDDRASFPSREHSPPGPPDGEIHTSDTVNEKLSLSDRFGITLTFPNLSHDEYIHVVLHLAETRGLAVDPVSLREQAARWALTQHQASGRTAKQFIDHIGGMAALTDKT